MTETACPAIAVENTWSVEIDIIARRHAQPGEVASFQALLKPQQKLGEPRFFYGFSGVIRRHLANLSLFVLWPSLELLIHEQGIDLNRHRPFLSRLHCLESGEEAQWYVGSDSALIPASSYASFAAAWAGVRSGSMSPFGISHLPEPRDVTSRTCSSPLMTE